MELQPQMAQGLQGQSQPSWGLEALQLWEDPLLQAGRLCTEGSRAPHQPRQSQPQAVSGNVAGEVAAMCRKHSGKPWP